MGGPHAVPRVYDSVGLRSFPATHVILISTHKSGCGARLDSNTRKYDSRRFRRRRKHARNPRRSHSLAIIIPNSGAMRSTGFEFARKRAISVTGRRATRTDGERRNTELRVVLESGVAAVDTSRLNDHGAGEFGDIR